ncbi:MAG: DUF3347 domain-containing protein [Chitinophagales bacterium]|nr:DUF3347 domain-containing protein [Chitinophagales bacterium]
MVMIVLLSSNACNAQIKHTKSTTVKIYGNCEMCEKTIEKAGNEKKVAQVDWNKDTKLATITFDSTKTNTNAILKKIALAGYDSDEFLAPEDAYANLPECCQYERVKKVKNSMTATTMNHDMHEEDMMKEDMKEEMKSNATNTDEEKQTKEEVNQLNSVFNNYFELKDAFVQSDASIVTNTAKKLNATIKAVNMNKLSMDEHMAWMKVVDKITTTTEQISKSNDIEKQRTYFNDLSENIYALIKVAETTTPVYYQHCPMYNDGANWLSKENAIKNPYYGNKMLSCGKTIEVIE